ncbi:hypothetical protein, partial [Nostoc sp. LPT]|uniref:hypothetical protein n=1 Tax=Nostoc sp. LPT TaxID=2815387 RepID=UPI0025EE87C7
SIRRIDPIRWRFRDVVRLLSWFYKCVWLFMNQAVKSLPVKLLYTALQFLIKFYYYRKPDVSH